MSYNAANQLSAHTDTALAAPAPVSMTAVYDGYLRRVKQVAGGVTRYSVYDAGGGLTQIDEVGGAKTDYIRASGMTLARIAGKVLDRKAEESSVNLGHSQNRTFATIVATGSLGPCRLRLSGWASGRVASVLSFGGLTGTRPDFAESGHYDFDPLRLLSVALKSKPFEHYWQVFGAK